MDSIAVIDFGSQYAQLIVRRVREARVYCEMFPWDAAPEVVLASDPKGFILSGGPASVYADGAPQIQGFILASELPILGICYGMQALNKALGGEVSAAIEREFGSAVVTPIINSTLLPGQPFPAWMSHGDRLSELAKGFMSLAKSENSPFAAIGDPRRNYYGVQFHPEVRHTPDGAEILRHFAVDICKTIPEWTAENIINESVARICSQVGQERVLAAVSGGVDSSVATALVHRAIGDQLVAMFVNTGLMRKDEPEQVISSLQKILETELVTVDVSKDFLNGLAGVIDPEEKRHIAGEKFIRIFEKQARDLGMPPFLVQGTIYPDVVESAAPERNKAQRIKTHHNVGGLPADLSFQLVEPLRFLFKDEVREVGETLGLPEELVWRQPFPGPGLAVRCLGEVTAERVARLREADAILGEELVKENLIGKGADTSQAFVVLLPVRSVGVMGDVRTYQETAAIRVVVTDDFMTADWVRLPYELLARVSNRIVNEVHGINRVVYDITSKPPATIEWE